MAESESGQEKSEEPTGKRIDKSREEGEVARSRELGTTVLLIVSILGIIYTGDTIARALIGSLSYNLSLSREQVLNEAFLLEQFSNTAGNMIETLIPLFVIFFLAAISGSSIFGGVLFTFKSVMPKPNRMDPLKGLKRMFSMNSLVELFKSLAKFLLVAGGAIIILKQDQYSILSLSRLDLTTAMSEMVGIISWSAFYISLTMIIITAIDVPFQAFQHKKKLKMTKQEVKDESKDTEGKPEVKSKIRQLQYQMAQRRMMAAVPEADVVITNPDHFSIALKYDVNGTGAPILLAKGVDFMALKIREIANAHEIMIIEIPPLARAVYFTTEVDREIPEDLYLAVAQVLAYVFQLKAHKKGKGQRPRPLGAIGIPRDAQYDHNGKKV